MLRAKRSAQTFKFCLIFGFALLFLLNMNSLFNMSPTEGSIQTLEGISDAMNKVLKPLQGVTQDGFINKGVDSVLGSDTSESTTVESVETAQATDSGVGNITDWVTAATDTVIDFLRIERRADKEYIMASIEQAAADLGYEFNARDAENRLRSIVGPNALNMARTEEINNHNTMEA